jgi:hypothetical protein
MREILSHESINEAHIQLEKREKEWEKDKDRFKMDTKNILG